MSNFSELTYLQQVHRLRKLGQKALAGYEIKPLSMHLLDHAENTTFRIVAKKKRSKKISQYVLRIHRDNYHSEEGIQTELEWLHAICQDTQLIVPQPIVGKNGQLLQKVSEKSVPQERRCVLFKWVEGRFLAKSLSSKALYQVGKLTATLQRHGHTLDLPGVKHRPYWDIYGLIGDNGIWGTPNYKEMNKRDREIILEARQQITDKFVGTENPQCFGLIHADLHHGNYIFQNGKVRAIDFDDCGYGYYMYDLAVTLSSLRRHKKIKELEEGLFQGYSEHNPPTKLDPEMVATLRVARRICTLGWVWSRSDVPEIRKCIPQSTKDAAECCRRYLK